MFVYAIYNKQCNKIYIGQTENLDERIKLHNNKEFVGSYTSRFIGKWELIYKEEVKNRKEALMREKQLKSYQGRQFIKNILNTKALRSPVVRQLADGILLDRVSRGKYHSPVAQWYLPAGRQGAASCIMLVCIQCMQL